MSLTFERVELPTYKKAVKKLKKRFRNIEKDIDDFFETVSTVEDLGVRLHESIFKARIRNRDKSSGKSGGYRLITYLVLSEGRLYQLYVYDKSDLANISDKELDRLVVERFLETSDTMS